MKLLDLFCGAGGCSMGYHRAGFEVTGIDIKPQPRYPFRFIQGDALNPPVDLNKFDAIHASPPCQSYSRALRHMATPQPKLLDEVRRLFDQFDGPTIIENVVGAPMINPLILCGTMFGLRIQRHRLFELRGFSVLAPSCRHIGTELNPVNRKGIMKIRQEFNVINPELPWKKEMDVDWMKTRPEFREAIPPIYTEFIGRQLLESLP